MARRQTGLTAVEVLVIVVLVLLVAALMIPTDGCGGRRCVARNGSTRATLEDLRHALANYQADYGTVPSKAGGGLSADTKLFVECLARKGPKGVPYYAFREDDLVNGEFLSPHGKPYYYTFPVKGVPGPDGKAHPEVDYYLWTWGCLTDPPDADWEINNWTRP